MHNNASTAQYGATSEYNRQPMFRGNSLFGENSIGEIDGNCRVETIHDAARGRHGCRSDYPAEVALSRS
jgi:hypothetical protein